ncbi:ATP-binding cassette domain-containing protein [Ruthenibacterium lactatiformans]|uniref:ATP-binding cassette domain-containing protein n=1 Tax=Ruthenibacterium lactatiformans TaxID=1550024 RepID=UPI00399F207C
MDERTAKLTLKNISKTFYDRQGEHPTIADVSFEVYDNEFLVILGPGLCGKTVLLNAVAGLERPTSGHVFLNGRELHGTDPTICMVFQKRLSSHGRR